MVGHFKHVTLTLVPFTNVALSLLSIKIGNCVQHLLIYQRFKVKNMLCGTMLTVCKIKQMFVSKFKCDHFSL